MNGIAKTIIVVDIMPCIHHTKLPFVSASCFINTLLSSRKNCAIRASSLDFHPAGGVVSDKSGPGFFETLVTKRASWSPAQGAASGHSEEKNKSQVEKLKMMILKLR
jgi:hypothetical protein